MQVVPIGDGVIVLIGTFFLKNKSSVRTSRKSASNERDVKLKHSPQSPHQDF